MRSSERRSPASTTRASASARSSAAASPAGGGLEEALEFQTRCDFTPALFGSSGLSVAYTVPLRRAGEGRPVGVISTRLRFERILDRVQARSFREQGNGIWFVADDGSYFDEAINGGDVAPPIEGRSLTELLARLDEGGAEAISIEREDDVLHAFTVEGLSTIEGGGIHVVVRVTRAWLGAELERGERLAKWVLAGAAVAVVSAVYLAVWLAFARRARRRNELQRVVAEAQSAAKSEFLANTSHEIRTPMTAILGYADLLSAPGRGAAVTPAEAANAIKRNGEYLLSLLNDILDLAKIEAGALTVELGEVDAVEACREVEELLLARAREKQIELALEPVWPLPEWVRTDAMRLRQVLVNLVGNAIKFTERGEVRTRVSYVPGSEGQRARLRIAISDTGIGIEESELARLFAPFEQASSSTARRFGGTGLGLAISRRLAERLGGALTAHSTPGEGSTFELELELPADGVGPLRTTEQHRAQAADPPRAATAAPLAGLHVLLVDDGDDNRRIVSVLLERAGAEVTALGSGRDAIETIERDPNAFDLILMDVQMPLLDGVDTTAALRERGCETPVVALTADALSGSRERYMALGFDAYAAKPIDGKELVDVALGVRR